MLLLLLGILFPWQHPCRRLDARKIRQWKLCSRNWRKQSIKFKLNNSSRMWHKQSMWCKMKPSIRMLFKKFWELFAVCNSSSSLINSNSHPGFFNNGNPSFFNNSSRIFSIPSLDSSTQTLLGLTRDRNSNGRYALTLPANLLEEEDNPHSQAGRNSRHSLVLDQAVLSEVKWWIQLRCHSKITTRMTALIGRSLSSRRLKLVVASVFIECYLESLFVVAMWSMYKFVVCNRVVW